MKARKTTEQDRQLISDWIGLDSHHRDKVKADFFIAPRKGVDHFAVEDAGSRVVFYVTIEKIARVHVQFNADGDTKENAIALIWLWRFLKANLPRLGICEVITESVYDKLIRFLKRAMKFQTCEDTYSLRLDGDNNVR